MKIGLRIQCPPDALQLLSREKQIADAISFDAGVMVIDSDDKLLDRVLDITKNTSGLWFNPVMSFTKSEVLKARYLQLECRKVVHETDRDYELNSARLEQLDFIETTDKCRIKLLDQVALSKINIKPNMVAGVDQWTAEFLITSTVATLFEKEGFTGLNLQPVLNPKTEKHHSDYYLLYTVNIMPPVAHDVTIKCVEKEIPEEGGFRELGCLTYDFKTQGPEEDFYRTAENFSSNFMPFWVVSARVRQCFQQNKLRGWAFRPVLEKGSKLHDLYIAKWQSLMERITINPRSIF